jgi:hypothetical protein
MIIVKVQPDYSTFGCDSCLCKRWQYTSPTLSTVSRRGPGHEWLGTESVFHRDSPSSTWQFGYFKAMDAQSVNCQQKLLRASRAQARTNWELFRKPFYFSTRILPNSSEKYLKNSSCYFHTQVRKWFSYFIHCFRHELHANDNQQAKYKAYLSGFVLKINQSNEHFLFQFCIYVI